MHEIGVDVHSVEVCAPPHRTESRTQGLWACEIAGVEFEPYDFEIAFVHTLIAEATHFYGHRLGQLA
jgi:hypothetical protein